MDLHVGDSVWAPYRGKWEPGIVLFGGKRRVSIGLEHVKRPIHRHYDVIRSRDPKKHYHDKPIELVPKV